MVQQTQLHIGAVAVTPIILAPTSRDDIPQILRGLPHLYQDPATRATRCQLLEAEIAPQIDTRTGRPGMTRWSIVVCGVIRLDLNLDYDRLQERVTQHNPLRPMLGHGRFDPTSYPDQTLKDHVRLFTPELRDTIHQIVVNVGHERVRKKAGDVLRGRCDAFVGETAGHDPTDIRLLVDATRTVIELSARLAAEQGLPDWRQHADNVTHLNRHLRAAQSAKHSTARNDAQQEKNDARVIEAHQTDLDVAQGYLDKAQETLAKAAACGGGHIEHLAAKIEIETFMQHAVRQIDQTRRRVILGETIPHAETVFSVFQTHTEWISKGKAGVPVELGVRVCIMEDQHRFVLHHRVMEKQTDDQVTVAMVKETKERFANLDACRVDTGFHSLANQQELQAPLTLVALPRKGTLSQQAQAVERAADFVKARRQHSAVESALNALEVHGLDRCPDQGMRGFTRDVALAVVARNIQRIGALLREQENRRSTRQTRDADRDSPHKLAA